MAITFPLTDLMSICEYSPQGQPWELARRQEFSRTAGGRTIGKDIGGPLWSGGFSTIPLHIDDMLDVEAMLNSLDGVIGTFEAHDLRRPYPKEHADGVFGDTGTIFSVNANNKAISLTGLDIGFTVSRGDYLEFTYATNRYLLQAMESATAVSGGVTPEFEVRPHLPDGMALSPAIAVTLKQPSAICSLVPGSVSKSMISGIHGTVSFQAVQVLT